MEDSMKPHIHIANTIDAAEVISLVSKPQFGAVDLFIGQVRNHTKGKAVVKLFFECYHPMALDEMEKIAELAKKQFDIQEIAIHHATGEKLPGDVVVLIAVSSYHRDAAFKACQFAIDTLKETVPIWKKEFFEDGEIWVAAHP